jgi:cell fate regulator YaaT (PSP1 superfamily)
MPTKQKQKSRKPTVVPEGPVFRIKIIHSSATEYCTTSIEIGRGDHVIVPTRYGKALGVVLGEVSNRGEIGSSAVLRVDRKATLGDLERYRRNRQKDERAFAVCQEKIEQHGLEMKLVSAHYLLGEPKIVFFFTAESRVDFRALVKDLVSVLKTRIELRQIGVRDESRVLGGMGVCGRAFCCHKLSDKLNPVSIKMAKKQDLSLNSMKISGPCGRLLCCLAYEHDYYNVEKGKLPSTGTRLRFEEENCRVTDVNLLTRRIKLVSESGRSLELPAERFELDSRSKRWSIVEDRELEEPVAGTDN